MVDVTCHGEKLTLEEKEQVLGRPQFKTGGQKKTRKKITKV